MDELLTTLTAGIFLLWLFKDMGSAEEKEQEFQEYKNQRENNVF